MAERIVVDNHVISACSSKLKKLGRSLDEVAADISAIRMTNRGGADLNVGSISLGSLRHPVRITGTVRSAAKAYSASLRDYADDLDALALRLNECGELFAQAESSLIAQVSQQQDLQRITDQTYAWLAKHGDKPVSASDLIEFIRSFPDAVSKNEIYMILKALVKTFEKLKIPFLSESEAQVFKTITDTITYLKAGLQVGIDIFDAIESGKRTEEVIGVGVASGLHEGVRIVAKKIAGKVGIKGGAAVGAAIGSIFPGPGTVIGGTHGGAVGYLVSTELTGKLVDYVFDDLGVEQWVADRVTNIADSVGSALQDAGDAVNNLFGSIAAWRPAFLF